MLARIVPCLLLVSVVFANIPAYVPQDLKELIESLRSSCMPKIGVTEDEISNYEISNNSPKMMCYMKCMLTESKWMSPDGTIQYDRIIESTHDDMLSIIQAALGKCKDIPGGSHECDKAYNFNVCLQQADPVHYFLA